MRTSKAQTIKDDTKETFPKRLLYARERRGLTQEQLAKLAQIPPSSISCFEAGKRSPSLNSLRKITFALNVSSDYFLGRTDNFNSEILDGIMKKFDELVENRATAELFINYLYNKENS